MRIAVATSENAAQLTADEPILLAALARAGAQAELRRWDLPLDWSSYDAVVLRSTWDYFTRLGEFLPWLERVQGLTRLVNDYDLVRWNLDKRYLLELEAAGVPIVPTQLVTDAAALDGALAALTTPAILKPVVGGGAYGLHMVGPGATLVPSTRGPWLVQPLVDSIRSEGELSVIVLDGAVSHGIRKRPAPGDIRVQREHGGRYEVEVPSAEVRELAARVLAACPGEALYGRVDLVWHRREWQLMEVELVEPELFFAMVPAAAEVFARALRQRLGGAVGAG